MDTSGADLLTIEAWNILLQADFPARWQSAFQDVIGLLADGAGTADLFCRILTSVDEDVISLEIPRHAATVICRSKALVIDGNGD